MSVPSVPTTFSSSSTLWATPSKEWIIAPRPKPGRKPKKDLPTVKDTDDPDGKCRRVQNRAAQRAFRERKQSQLAELQARVQSYEQGEIERNVALQNVAKRLKEENDTLRRENQLLKEKFLRIEQEHGILQDGDKRRWRDDSPTSSISSVRSSSRKRTKICSSNSNLKVPPSLTSPYIPSPPSMVSSPDSNGSADSPYSPVNYDRDSEAGHNSIQLIDYTQATKPSEFDTGNGFPAFDCGFCNEGTPCVCREMAVQQDRPQAVAFKAENYSQPTATMVLPTNHAIHLDTVQESARPSILDNLPAFQPAVPLRRKPGATNPSSPPVFPVISLQEAQGTTTAMCTGDPSNCMACADDAFGKAFCTALGQSIASHAPCPNCPCSQNGAMGVGFATGGNGGCCGNPEGCDRHISASMQSSSQLANGMQPDTIATNDAWQQIKSHPKVSFADLALLADVVARRSKCTGPTVIISPAPGEVTPERLNSPTLNVDSQPYSDQGSVLLTDPHAHYREKERVRLIMPTSQPRLVSQDVLVRCGRRRLREVPADAVRDALRLLDAKFP
ncbi:hypothetical protein AMATHDRAFT_44418 [Amanita thiersii Skay4041]|uniref:BZIP domain-containing protein n=1 Tax=Amanita thiersii Skay4041 TaxID=703135 RepID=A0A2A9NYB7_9AGAR|nr:hypothetical protein AMATHDRAFT_44418 [Amanita thiersii Skay4041]